MYDSEKIQAVIEQINNIADSMNFDKKVAEDAFEAVNCVATVAVKTCEEENGQPCVCGALVQCTSAIDKSEAVHIEKRLKNNTVKVAEIEQLDECDIYLEKTFSGCMFSYKNKCILSYEDNMIEGDVWQDIDTGLKQGPTGGTLNANWSYMICNYGPGIIYFKDSGQDLRTKVYREAVPKMFGFKYNWAKEGTVTPEFMKRVIEISSDLKIDPDDLMATIARESRFDPKIQNSSGAYGLIQFTKDSIDEINRVNGTQYSKEDIKKMNAMEQLEMVYLHYKPFAGKMHNLGDVYLVTFAPSTPLFN